ncbi:ACD_00300 [African swine fever virus]
MLLYIYNTYQHYEYFFCNIKLFLYHFLLFIKKIY